MTLPFPPEADVDSQASGGPPGILSVDRVCVFVERPRDREVVCPQLGRLMRDTRDRIVDQTVLADAPVDIRVDGIPIIHVPQDHTVAGPNLVGAELGSSRQIAHATCELPPLRSARRRAAFAEIWT